MLPTRRRRKTVRSQSRSWFSFKRLSSLLYVSWETEIFNNCLFRWGLRYSRYWKPWFNIGVVFGLIAMVVSIGLMLLQLASLFANSNFRQGPNADSTQIMTLVIPGVNVPWSDLPCMILATIFAVGFHELGHALAAASEGICAEYVAIFLACLIPGALIALNEDHLQLLNSVQALRVYSAGILHNFLCCAICYLVMLLFPLLLFPFYSYSESPAVLHIGPTSPLEGHIRPGDIILEANGIKVRNFEDWVQILQYPIYHEVSVSYLKNHTAQLNKILKIPSEPPYYISTQGHCIPQENYVMQRNAIHNAACSNETILFYELASESPDVHVSQRLFCLNSTAFVKQRACSTEKSTCSEGSSCLLSVLRHGEVLVDMKFQHLTFNCSLMTTNASCHQSLVYVGELKNLIYSLTLTNFLSRQLSLGFFRLTFMRGFPDAFWRLLAYTMSISIIMVVSNSVPVFHLDGEEIIRLWIRLFFAYSKINVHPNHQKKIVLFCLITGSILWILFLASGVINTML